MAKRKGVNGVSAVKADDKPTLNGNGLEEKPTKRAQEFDSDDEAVGLKTIFLCLYPHFRIFGIRLETFRFNGTRTTSTLDMIFRANKL